MAGTLKLLKTIFWNDAIQRALPTITFLAGLCLFAASYVVYPALHYPVRHDLLKSLGQTILVSGLIGMLLTTLKYIGIFQDAVHDVVFGDAYLKTRTDLPAIWTRVTAAISQGKFPQLSKQLEADVLSTYIPTQKDFFCSGYKHECVIRPMDGRDDVVLIHEKIEFVLHPADAHKAVSYPYESYTDSRTPPDIAKLNLIGLYVDDQKQDITLKQETYQDEFGRPGLKQSYALTLSGKAEYRIRRLAVRKLRIAEDPVIEYASNQFILRCEAKFKSEIPHLVPIFQPVGVGDFDDRAMGAEDNWHVSREFNGLLFPRQGYMLFVQRRL